MDNIVNTESSIQTPSENYDSIKEKPESLSLLVNKFVKLQLIKNCSFDGFVNSIDPVSYSIIINKPCGDTYQTILIPGHAILNVVEAISPPNIETPPRLKSSAALETGIIDLKLKIISWLKLNLLSVTEEGDRIVFGSASLLPPYSVTNICTDNPMVAIQMKKLIESMPPDFNPE
ncbi:uncharacterized protein ACR2FA_001408 [Aphomia sociella]